MTREEAIQVLTKWQKRIKECGVPNWADKVQAIDMAISVLSAERDMNADSLIKLQEETIAKQKVIISELEILLEVFKQSVKTDDVLFRELGSNENRSD